MTRLQSGADFTRTSTFLLTLHLECALTIFLTVALGYIFWPWAILGGRQDSSCNYSATERWVESMKRVMFKNLIDSMLLRCTTSNVDNWCAQVQEERCASFAMLSSGSESANTFRPVRGRDGLLRYVLRAYCGTKNDSILTGRVDIPF